MMIGDVGDFTKLVAITKKKVSRHGTSSPHWHHLLDGVTDYPMFRC
jgi:hypothetical protein